MELSVKSLLLADPSLIIDELITISLSATNDKLPPTSESTFISLETVIVPASALSGPDAATEPLPTLLEEDAVDIETSFPASRALTIAVASEEAKV